mgnify:CR=1 FL=1
MSPSFSLLEDEPEASLALEEDWSQDIERSLSLRRPVGRCDEGLLLRRSE